MNTEEARVKTSGRHGRGYGDERGVKPARDRDLPRCSVEILRDLGLSKEKIVASTVAFRHRRPQRAEARRRGQGKRDNAVSKESFDPQFHSSPLSVPVRLQITDSRRP